MYGRINLGAYDIWNCGREERHREEDDRECLWGPLKTPEVSGEKPIAAGTPAIQGLANELLFLIFDNVKDPMDRFCLAMTCRQFFKVATDFNLVVPSGVKHRDDGGKTCPGMLRIMHWLAPVDDRKKESKAWKLCCDCYSYRPKKKAYWLKKGKQYKVTRQPYCGVLELYLEVVKDWYSTSLFQCPECWCKQTLDEDGHPHECERC
ncbi:unnamed protein product [Clonostachys rosea]|uniref:F-box domain-containing protein n=1 Tax=Bionectria ochroleuca TaxID=29856 RepID=A0ABY6UZT6_BIOOC|nr:unnamed protein product [Clonostachys rosea]